MAVVDNDQHKTRASSTYRPIPSFNLPKGEAKQYRQQYGDIYFLRLARLKPPVEAVAHEAWEGYELGGETVRRVERVLDVRQGQLCWVAGTVYMDMPLKPNILDDITKDHWIAAPPLRDKYISPDGKDRVMLEDESGRLRLIGVALENQMLVTGCIIAVLGTEAANGDFEVIEMKIPDLPTQPDRWSLDAVKEADPKDMKKRKAAIISGLAITGESGDTMNQDLMAEWLLGESHSEELQESASHVSRLIIAGNSLAEVTPFAAREDLDSSAGNKKVAAAKKYGYDASAYNPAPTQQLDALLSEILPSIPVTLLPGDSDPANVSLPQQPLHPALFPSSRAYSAIPPSTEITSKSKQAIDPGTFHSTTNPCSFTLAGHLWLGTGGQPTNDIAKYIDPSSPLDLIEATLRWRLLAPTAPDTLWCYPYQTDDPFVLKDGACPHLYFVGNQPQFETRMIEGPHGQRVRLIAVPEFASTGEVVLVDEDSLEVEVIRFSVHDGI